MTTDLDLLPWNTPNPDPAPVTPPIPAEDPLVIQVTRYQCPHCRQSRSKKTAAIAHIGRCWKNPAVRACKTCQHHLPAYSSDDGHHPDFSGRRLRPRPGPPRPPRLRLGPLADVRTTHHPPGLALVGRATRVGR